MEETYLLLLKFDFPKPENMKYQKTEIENTKKTKIGNRKYKKRKYEKTEMANSEKSEKMENGRNLPSSSEIRFSKTGKYEKWKTKIGKIDHKQYRGILSNFT